MADHLEQIGAGPAGPGERYEGSAQVVAATGAEAEALEVCRQDVYMQNGVWVELRAKAFGRLRLAEVGPA